MVLKRRATSFNWGADFDTTPARVLRLVSNGVRVVIKSLGEPLQIVQIQSGSCESYIWEWLIY